MRILIVDDHEALRKAMIDVLTRQEDIALVDGAANGAEALKMLCQRSYDVVVTDIVMPVMDGFALMESISRSRNASKPRIIVLTALMRDDFIQRAVNAGADYYMLKPYDPQVVVDRILDLTKPAALPTPLRPTAPMPSCSVDERIANVFLSMGIPAHIKGYHFLREAIKTVVDNPETINAITKELYPAVAKRFNTSASKVERAIRHAIDVAWSRGQVENLNQLFGSRIYVKSDKPTNGEFIALIADKVSVKKSA